MGRLSPVFSMPAFLGQFSSFQLVKGILFLALITACLSTESLAQATNAHAKITIGGDASLRIEIQASEAADSWSFRNAYAGSVGLGDRIGEFKATGVNQPVEIRKAASGEFRSSARVANYSYSVELRTPEPGSMSHVSWLTTENGVLMLADLLPLRVLERHSNLTVEFLVPNDWTVNSSILSDDSSYVIPNPEGAVFLVGRSVRTKSRQVSGTELHLFVSGNWPFSNAKAVEMAATVFKKYATLTSYNLKSGVSVMIAPMPVRSSVSQWKAETRGSTVVLLIDPSAKFSTWSGQLGVVFTHEIFHLWVPNSLDLDGDYDWFFEGFTLYQGLLIALDLKLINFQEYLNTLARVYDSYLAYSRGISLIEASERRWSSGGSLVYDKGMLVAFMYDLMARKQSGGSFSDVYRQLFATSVDKPANANDVIIRLLSSSPATHAFCEKYIVGRDLLDFERFLSEFGFSVDSSGSRSKITPSTLLTTEQQGLLRSLGYKK